MTACLRSCFYLLHEILFFLSASPDLLKDMAGHMTPKIGLVLQMPFVCDRKGFAGVYEKVCFLVDLDNKFSQLLVCLG